MKKSRFTDSQILAILKQAENGVPVTELCREHGMSSASFYKWRAKFGGMDASVIIPFLVALQSRAYAASLRFIAGVMPPMPMFGRSLLYVHSQAVANPCISSRDSKIY